MKTIVFLYILLTPLALFAQSFEDLEKESLAKNKVKTKTQFVISSHITGKTAEIDYTEQGDVKEKSSYSKKGVITSTERYEYDNMGNRTYYERTNQNGSYWKRSEYNKNNKLVEENGFDGSEHFRNQYTYTDNGKLLEIVYITNNTVSEKRIYKHSGNQAIVEGLKGGTSLHEKVRLVYDDDNNILEETVLGLDGKETGTKKYTYNNNSQVITEEKYFEGNLIYTLSYKYDSEGRLLSQSEETSDQEKFVEKSYKYDDKGLLIEYHWRRRATEKFNTKKYKYNDKGLCIEIDTFYPATKFSIITGYEYEFF